MDDETERRQRAPVHHSLAPDVQGHRRVPFVGSVGVIFPIDGIRGSLRSEPHGQPELHAQRELRVRLVLRGHRRAHGVRGVDQALEPAPGFLGAPFGLLSSLLLSLRLEPRSFVFVHRDGFRVVERAARFASVVGPPAPHAAAALGQRPAE